jgi:leader peptidase (prepilin peptidase)/N-methyltransferase
LPAFLFLAVLGVQLARIDFSLHLLPNPLVLVLLAGGALLLLAGTVANGHWEPAVRAAAGCTLLFVTYLALALVTPGAIGMGDIKLAAPIGLYLGHLGWTHLLYGGLLGFVVNGVVTIVTVARSRGTARPTEVAHGPSMLIAATAVALFLPSLN